VGSTQREPHEWLDILGDTRYHNTPTLNDDIDEVYQEESSSSFVVEPSVGLEDFVGDVDDIQMHVKRKHKPIKEKVSLSV
jgi:hypothetical protein